MISSKVDGDKGTPDNAGAVHSKSNVLGLVEILGNVSGLESIDGAQYNQEHVVEQGDHGRHLTGSTFQYLGILVMFSVLYRRFFKPQPGESSNNLKNRTRYLSCLEMRKKNQNSEICDSIRALTLDTRNEEKT